MELTIVWFALIAFVWAGYFLLEGFDFGVGILLPVLGRNESQRTSMLQTIGPVWDGNEVWLIVAAGATFAAFPEWYATLLSGFYLPFLAILIALIFRGIAIEYRGVKDSPLWRQRWDAIITGGSLIPAFLWGVVFGDIVRGIPLNANHDHTGDWLALINPYALVGGATTLAIFTAHGAVFLALKTDGDIRTRAGKLAPVLILATITIGIIFLLWTYLAYKDLVGVITSGITVVALILALLTAIARREGFAFLSTGIAIIATVCTLFIVLYPNVMPSSLDPTFNLTIDNAASSPYTLKIMTWVAIIFTPLVITYQSWTYWVFRKRIKT